MAADDVIIPGSAIDRISTLATNNKIIAGAPVDHIRAAAIGCPGKGRLDLVACRNLQEACRVDGAGDAHVVAKQQVVARRCADPVYAGATDDQVIACAGGDHIIATRGREQRFHQCRQVRACLRIGEDHPTLIAQDRVGPSRRANCGLGRGYDGIVPRPAQNERAAEASRNDISPAIGAHNRGHA